MGLSCTHVPCIIIKPLKSYPWLFPQNSLIIIYLSPRELEYLFVSLPGVQVNDCFLRKFLSICMFICAHECSSYAGQKRVLDPWEPEFQKAVSCCVWVLNTEIGPSARSSIKGFYWLSHVSRSDENFLNLFFCVLRIISRALDIPGKCSNRQIYLQLLLFL